VSILNRRHSRKLAGYPHIAAIKEASGNIAKVVDTAALVGKDLAIYSGNDDQVIPLLSLGGMGVISVLSNLMPKETSLMCQKYFQGDTAGAAEMQLAYLPLIHALFSEVNPIPVKAAMAAMGYGANCVRLPLVSMEETHEQKLIQEMQKLNLL